MTPILTTPDQTDRAQELMELWMSVDPEAQVKALARLIAATLHAGPGSALERRRRAQRTAGRVAHRSADESTANRKHPAN